jgi:hypothetical protein
MVEALGLVAIANDTALEHWAKQLRVHRLERRICVLKVAGTRNQPSQLQPLTAALTR